MIIKKQEIDGTVICEIDSSNLAKSIYYKEDEILVLEFKKGVPYTYFGVPQVLHEGFVNSESQGKFFIKEIKNNPEITYVKGTSNG